MADKYAHIARLSPAERERRALPSREKAVNILGCRMPFSEAEACVADLEQHGPLSSIDEHTAVAVLHGRMSRVRAVACARDLRHLLAGQQGGDGR